MNKTELVAAVAAKSELSKKDAEAAVNAVVFKAGRVACAPHLYVRVDVVNLVGNFLLEPSDNGYCQNHDDDGKHHADNGNGEARRGGAFLPSVQLEPPCYHQLVLHIVLPGYAARAFSRMSIAAARSSFFKTYASRTSLRPSPGVV